MIKELTTNKFLSPDEISRLLKHVDVECPNRDQLLIKFALMTGARASEILRLTVASFNKELFSVHIKGNKGSLDREFKLPKKFFNQLMKLGFSHGGRLFPITYQRLHQVWVFYRPNGKKFHSLRHTFAIEGYKRHHDILAVQRALGHKSALSTQVYLDFVYTEKYMMKMLWNFQKSRCLG